MKINKIKKHLTIIFSDETVATKSNCSDEFYSKVLACGEDENKVKNLVIPKVTKEKEEYKEAVTIMEKLNTSEYLTVKGNSVFILSISELSLPLDLAKAMFKAEEENELQLLSSYLNFWTLCSLNPNSESRINLFWFLNKYGMTISKSGLFVAYRNVKVKQEGKKIDSTWSKFITDSYSHVKYKLKRKPIDFLIGLNKGGEKICSKAVNRVVEQKGNLEKLYHELSDESLATVYTDQHSGKFTIKIGNPVTMKRSLCDESSRNTCSNGLHVAGRGWLEKGYFGDTGIKVLVSPADVVAVPPVDNYGKMRTCAYYPISIVTYGDDRRIIDEEIKDGFEDNFMDVITYTGEINKDDKNPYVLDVPKISEISREKILARLSDIKEIIKLKEVVC